MPHWTTFDEETSSTLHAKLPEQAVIELSGDSALEHALASNETMVAVMPCRGLGQAALAVFRWNQVPASPPPRLPLATTRAGGFLGLADEPLFDNEEPAEKKTWWKRLWED